MSSPDHDRQDDLAQRLEAIQRRLRTLSIAVIVMALALVLLTISVCGDLLMFWGVKETVIRVTSIGAALLGFAFGWFARRRA